MKLILFIGLGSFIGGVLRYLLSQFIQAKFLSTFPFGTLSINILGCLVIGVVVALSDRTSLAPEWRLFLATGFCGGFTTMSAFSNETFSMLREGQLWNAWAYVLASLILCVVATFIGFIIPRFF
jgi:CrcB protein